MTTRFPTSYRWSAYVTPNSPQRVAQKSNLSFLWIKFKINQIKSATNFQRQSCTRTTALFRCINASAVRASEKCSIITYRKLPWWSKSLSIVRSSESWFMMDWKYILTVFWYLMKDHCFLFSDSKNLCPILSTLIYGSEQRCQVSRFWREISMYTSTAASRIAGPISRFHPLDTYILPHGCFFVHFCCTTNPSTVVFESNLMNPTILNAILYLKLHYLCSY